MKSPISSGPVVYPNNLTFGNLYYFLFAPTLCYELNFPRSPRIRKVFLLRRIGEILVLLSLQYCLGQQWILPILRTLDRPLNQYSTLENIERLLRLSLPNHLLWLILFYVYFHSTMNLIAEILCFGDRLFYRDWWNATDLYEFWNRWNTSVHEFCKRHVYKPLVNQYGFNKVIGSLVVFAISAFFHEVILLFFFFHSVLDGFHLVFNQCPSTYVTSMEFPGNDDSSTDGYGCSTSEDGE